MTASIKIVIVSGQEFSVPADTSNEAIRETLKASFPDVGTAELKTGTRATEDHGEVETVEFVKRAGTKGLDGRDLAALFDRVPPEPPPPTSRQRLTPQVRALLAGQLTCADALAAYTELTTALDAADVDPRPTTQHGGALCSRLDALPAVAVLTPHGW